MRCLVWLLVLAVAHDASADPCVTRRKFGADSVRDGKLVGGKLVFCTYGSRDQCWAMDPTTRAFTPAPTTPRSETKYSEEVDPTGRAKATQTGVEFCPTKDTCKKYKYKFPFEGLLWVAINAEGTLGAVTVEGDSMENQPTWVLLYDLAKRKQVKRFQSAGAHVFGTSFLVDETFYTPAGKKLGKLPAKLRWDAGPVRLERSPLIALADKFRAKLYLIDATTAKLEKTIDLPLPSEKGESIDSYQLVSSPDGTRLHVVSGAPNTGEVITIDPATGKEVARSAPPICK